MFIIDQTEERLCLLYLIQIFGTGLLEILNSESTNSFRHFFETAANCVFRKINTVLCIGIFVSISIEIKNSQKQLTKKR